MSNPELPASLFCAPMLLGICARISSYAPSLDVYGSYFPAWLICLMVGVILTIIEYIMENLAGSPTLEQIAAVVHLSPYHFARQFKAATGLAPHQYVIARRIERAQKLLLTDGELGMAEVAFRSGFANQSHFCLHFKRIVGLTASQFRDSTTDRKRTQLR